MLVASMIVKVAPAHAQEVARQIGRIPGVSTYGVHKENNIVAVAEAHDETQLERLATYISENFEDVMGVYPTFVASDDGPPAV